MRSLTRYRARAGVAGTLAVAALAYFGADTWLNNDDVFYGSSAGLSPGYAHTHAKQSCSARTDHALAPAAQ